MTGKITFQRDKGFAKLVSTMQLGTLNVSPPVRMTPCPERLQLQTSWMGGHLDREDDNLERQGLGKSCSHFSDSGRRETFSVVKQANVHRNYEPSC